MTILDLNDHIVLEPSSYLYWIDLGILIIFTIDYLTRLFLSSNRKQFLKNNIFHLIAIIPFNSMFRIFRAFKLFRGFRLTNIFKMTRIVRGFALLGKLEKKFKIFVNTNGFIYAIYITVVAVVLGAIGIHFLEFKKLGDTFGDSLWWSFVTVSTVGYVDITPETVAGRIIAFVLLLVGIGFVGMFTATVTTYFLNARKSTKTENEYKTVIDISDLEKWEIKQILDYIDFMRNRK